MIHRLLSVLEVASIALQRAANGMLLVAGWSFVVTAGLVTFEVVARRLAAISVEGVTDLSGYLLGVGLTWGLPYALLTGGHIRVDVLVMKAPLRIRQYLHLAAIVGLSVFAVVLARRAWDVVFESLEYGSVDSSVFRIPLVVPQGLWAFGLSVFALTALVLTLRALLLVAVGDEDAVDRMLRTSGADVGVGPDAVLHTDSDPSRTAIETVESR